MDIRPGKQTFFREHALVTFVSFDEIYSFSANGPLLISKEHWRFQRYASLGAFPGPRMPDSYPAEISVPENVLARVAGKYMLHGSGIEKDMLRSIWDYFETGCSVEEGDATPAGA